VPETDLRDKLTSYISDALALEQNVEQMLSGMISTTSTRKRPGPSRSGCGRAWRTTASRARR
jgi:hypothetical protein